MQLLDLKQPSYRETSPRFTPQKNEISYPLFIRVQQNEIGLRLVKRVKRSFGCSNGNSGIYSCVQTVQHQQHVSGVPSSSYK